MLSEEALILLAAAGGVALLVLGVIELLWPSRPRHPVRRVRSASATPAPGATPPPPKPVAPETPAARPAPAPAAKAGTPVRKRRSKVSPHARPHARSAATPGVRPPASEAGAARGAPPVRSKPRAVEPAAPGIASPPVVTSAARPDRVERRPTTVGDRVDAPAPSAPPTQSAPPTPPAPPAAPPRQLDPALVETCFSLYQDRAYEEVVSTGEGALGRVRTDSLAEDDAHEIAALWAVVALTKQAQGDDEGARAALESALEIAPAAEGPTYRQHLAALSLNAATGLLARAAGPETDDRVGDLRAALAWAERGCAMAPADTRLRDAAAQARDALWPAYVQTVNRLLQRQEFETARRLLREALDDPGLPPERMDDFENLLSGTFGGEIGQLTAQAIRSMQEERESEALAALRRAEALLNTIADEALPPKRREEVDQRLWWGYTRLGVRRVEAGEYEEALEPLVRALRFADIGPDRQAETRATLARALEGVADVRALGIRQLNDDGHRDEAVLRTEALRQLLRSCTELGLSEDELSVAFAKTRRLVAELGMEDRA